METRPNDPVCAILLEDPNDFSAGITKRELMATKNTAAMVSSISCEHEYQRIKELASKENMSVSDWISRDAVKQADSLIKELNKNNGDLDSKYYLYEITEMYDGKEFDWCKTTVVLNKDENIQEFITNRIETECYSDRDENEEDKPQWENNWYTDHCGSAFRPGSYWEVTFEEYQVLKKYLH